jgi:hypothetical protein
MYFSMNPEMILEIVEERIREYGIDKFQSEEKMFVPNFIKLLKLYLRSTVVKMNGKYFRQKSGVCIGCRIAPILSNFYLGYVDRLILKELTKRGIAEKVTIIRYVDDYLIICEEEVDLEWLKEFLESSSRTLHFTIEEDSGGVLQFLDMELNAKEDGLCWKYHQRMEKALLPYASNHSRTIKNGIIGSCLRGAMTRSCEHCIEDSIGEQEERLKKGSYPAKVIASQKKKVLKSFIIKRKEKEEGEEIRRKGTMPFYHNITNKMRNVCNAFDIELLMRFPHKLGKLVNSGKEEEVCEKAKSTHTKFVECEREIIYDIPFSCDLSYVGQSGKCVNARLTEHSEDIDKNRKEGKHIVQHMGECECEALLKQTKIIGRHNTRIGRELIEAVAIRRGGDKIISEASIKLTPREIKLLCGNEDKQRDSNV